MSVALKYNTFYLHGDFYSKRVLNMTIWQYILGMLSYLVSDQLTRPQLASTSRLRAFLKPSYWPCSSCHLEKIWSIEIRLCSRKPVISLTPIELLWGRGLIKFLGHEVTVGSIVYPNYSITRQEAAAFERSQCTNNDLNHAVFVGTRSGNGYTVILLKLSPYLFQ